MAKKDEIIIGIYKITSPSGKVYIGQSHNINKRKEKYKSLYFSNQTKLHASVKKYGWGSHKFEIICLCPEEELDALEIHYINEHNSLSKEHGLNLKSGGSAGKHSEETKKKMSVSHTGKSATWLIGKKQSDETKSKRADSRKGYVHSEETKYKISNSNKGKRRSEEMKKKISAALTGRKLSPETILKYKNRIITDETRKKLSSSLKGKKRSEQTKKNMSRARIGLKLSEAHIKKLKEGWVKRKKKSNQLRKQLCLFL